MKPGKYVTQYQELRRAALAAGYKMLLPTDLNATLLCLVNPNTPTGDYMTAQQMKEVYLYEPRKLG